MKSFLLLGLAGLGLATSANAADLTEVVITGLNADLNASGTVWNTTPDSYYTAFLTQPFGNALNPNDEAVSDPTELGDNDFGLNGDGWPIGSTANSDPIYRITLGFADGASITGLYNISSGTFSNGTSAQVNGLRYDLTGFSWNRFPAMNQVSPFNAVPGGSTADYLGQVSFLATAVPEPVTWVMMIAGMGMIGGSLRYRRRKTNLAFA